MASLTPPVRRRILFLRLNLASFVAKDLEILRSRYEVIDCDCRTVGGIINAMRSLWSAELVFCWFGSVRFLPLAALARLTGRPVVIVSGGYDVACVPEIAYGNMLRPIPRFLGRWLFRLATRVLPVSESAAADTRTNAKVSDHKMSVVYHGYDPVGTAAAGAKEPLVLTVGNVDASTLQRKGLLTFAQVARLLPDVRFVLVGAGEPAAVAELQAVAGTSVELTGFIPQAELDGLFHRAKVYLQPSMHEGFGSAVAEAMLYDCIPVVSRRFSLTEVVGESGAYVEPNDVQGIAETIRAVLDRSYTTSEAPRARVLTKFPLDQRRARLLALVDAEFAGLP